MSLTFKFQVHPDVTPRSGKFLYIVSSTDVFWDANPHVQAL